MTIRLFAATLIMAIVATVAFAQEEPTTTVTVGTSPHDPTYPHGEIKVKSPRLKSSDTWHLDVHLHQSPRGPLPGLGWAGIRVTFHNLDPTEVDIDSIYPLLGPGLLGPYGYWLRKLPDQLFPFPIGPDGFAYLPEPFGPRSDNLGSVSRVVSFLWPFLNQNPSGFDLNPSEVRPMFRIVLHAKNTNLGRNSDVDVSIKLSDIWHMRGPLFQNGSTFFDLPKSFNLWVNSSINNSQQLHFDGISAQTLPYASKYRLPNGPHLYDNNGHWLHLQNTREFHRFGDTGNSVYIANPMMVTLMVGIEHVPESTALALAGVGIGCLVMAARARMRTKKVSGTVFGHVRSHSLPHGSRDNHSKPPTAHPAG